MLDIIFDKVITIYNRKFNSETQRDMWHPTAITRVSLYGGQKVALDDGGRHPADEYIVRIPERSMPSGYLTPMKYEKLTNVTGYWTIQNGDIVVPEKWAGVVKSDTAITKIHDRAFRVTACIDNLRGVKVLRHIRIEGK